MISTNLRFTWTTGAVATGCGRGWARETAVGDHAQTAVELAWCWYRPFRRGERAIGNRSIRFKRKTFDMAWAAGRDADVGRSRADH